MGPNRGTGDAMRGSKVITRYTEVAEGPSVAKRASRARSSCKAYRTSCTSSCIRAFQTVTPNRIASDANS